MNKTQEDKLIEDAKTLSAGNSQLRTFFENSELLIDDNLDEIRKWAIM